MPLFRYWSVRGRYGKSKHADPERFIPNTYRFCTNLNTDPEILLKRPTFKAFILFFEWYRKTHPGSKRLTSFESLWKCLRELYYDKTQQRMPDEVGKLVTNVCDSRF